MQNDREKKSTIGFIVSIFVLAIVFIILLSIKECSAQSNAISLSFEPTDTGIGLRYDHQITNDFGVYTGCTYGNYRFFDRSYLHNHIRGALGIQKYGKDTYGETLIVGVGLVGHYIGPIDIHCNDRDDIHNKYFYPLTMEILFGGTVWHKYLTILRIDPLRTEFLIDIGIKF